MTLAEFAMQHPHFWNVRYTKQNENTPITSLIGIGGGYNINADEFAQCLRQFDISYVDPNYDHLINNYLNSLSEEKHQEALNFVSSFTPQQFVVEVIDNLLLKPALIDNQPKINEQYLFIKIPVGSEIFKFCDKVIWLHEDEDPIGFNLDISAVQPLLQKNITSIKPIANAVINITGISLLQISQLLLDNVK